MRWPVIAWFWRSLCHLWNFFLHITEPNIYTTRNVNCTSLSICNEIYKGKFSYRRGTVPQYVWNFVLLVCHRWRLATMATESQCHTRKVWLLIFASLKTVEGATQNYRLWRISGTGGMVPILVPISPYFSWLLPLHWNLMCKNVLPKLLQEGQHPLTGQRAPPISGGT